MNLFSKQKMTELIDFSLALLKEHNIPFRSAITEMLKEQEYEHYVWFCLKYKTCEVCGHMGELHHVDQRGSKGYKTDDGRNERVTCLCRKHHSEIHADARAYEKYGIHGIYLTDSMIEKLKLVYPNQFKAYRRAEND